MAFPTGIPTEPSRRRHDLDYKWHIDWFNSVRTFAQNHYGRTYLWQSTVLDDVEVIDSAWCNLENNISGKSYLGPFWDPIQNKLKAYAEFSAGNIEWGATGEGVPTDPKYFTQTNDTVYVPVDATLYRKKDSDVGDTIFNGSVEQAIVITLPNNALTPNTAQNPNLTNLGSDYDDHRNTYFLGSVVTHDHKDPYWAPLAKTSVEANVPIRVRRRYGYEWPSVWASGTGDELEVIVDESLGPWNYEPFGTTDSWERMNNEAKTILEARTRSRDSVTFAEVTRVGLPAISFDNFANQELSSNGYGIVSHGVTNINITKNVQNWWQTKYSIKSHTPRILRKRPAEEPTIEAFKYTNTAIRRLSNKLEGFMIKRIRQIIEVNNANRPITSVDSGTNDNLGINAGENS